jgi:hypothetical protein
MKHTLKSVRRSGLMLFVCALLLSAFSPVPVRQDDPTVITLYVNTAEIRTPNESNYCNFGQGDGVSNEEYTVVVNVGETIMWQGASSNAPGTDLVQITSINYEGGKNVFGTNVLRDTRDNPGRVSGQVLYATNGNNYKYKISFTVTNNGAKRQGTYHIDPKIEVH